LSMPVLSGHPWEETYTENGEYVDPADELRIIKEFVTRIVSQSKDLDPRYHKILFEDFWELV
jgi:hypothetical protein